MLSEWTTIPPFLRHGWHHHGRPQPLRLPEAHRHPVFEGGHQEQHEDTAGGAVNVLYVVRIILHPIQA